jgi:hypothetical protein
MKTGTISEKGASSNKGIWRRLPLRNNCEVDGFDAEGIAGMAGYG